MKIGSSFLISGLALVLLSGPLQADVLIHVWECEVEDDTTRAELEELSVAWTNAAKTIKGAEGLEVYLNYPISGDIGDGEFLFIMVMPSATAWGQFEDGYDGSEAAKVDETWEEIASCSETSLWSSVAMQ